MTMRTLRLVACVFGLAALSAGVTRFVTAALDQDDSSPEPEPVWRRIDQSAYVGANRCAECHAQHVEDWKHTLHAKMIQSAVAEGPDRTIVADFTQPSQHRKFELEDVKWVIGSRWKQRFIGEVDGEEVVFPAQWSVKDRVWQSYGAREDWWHRHHPDWKGRSNFKLCAGCHSTGVDHYTQSWAELNISCEACHGPGKLHSDLPEIANIVNPARLDVARSKDVCFACHMAGKPPGTEYAWPVGYQPGMVLADFWQSFGPEPGRQSAELWENGTAHKNRVQGNTFEQSVMAHAGIQCTACHDQHGSRHQSMTTKSAETNALCMMCHGPATDHGPKFVTISDHTHHAPGSTGSRCIECHMPKTGKNSVDAEARNHTFDFISPADTLALGVPNSCNTCHTDQTVDWALLHTNEWYPEK
jgi:predicted CXXCH cytochrome family protein